MKKTFHMGFFANLWTPDLGKKIFTTWNVLKSKVYLTWINFWKFHDHLKACLVVISWPENVKFISVIFLCFWPPEKSVFELMRNLKFSFSESGPGSVHILQNQYFHLSFQVSKGTLKMLQITICPQIQQEKSLKWS